MNAANRFMILGALLAFSAGTANAGPCNTASRDAGSGNVPGYTGQTTGSTATEGQSTAADQSQQPAPAEQSQKKMAGTPEQTQPAPSEQSKKLTAGAAEPAPSEKKPAGAAEEGC